MVPDLQEIEQVHESIKSRINRTPVLTSSSINKIAGCEIFFKCENFQKTGAFKFRGANNALLSLSDEELSRGVATHSSGNHAAALALAARKSGVKAYIVMPRNAPRNKVNAVKEYGGNIIFCEPTQQSREETLNDVVSKNGAVFIHPFNDYRIIAGQATAALELIRETGNLDYVIAPVGGGGLLSGTSLAVKLSDNNTKVIGAEPSGADDAYRSIRDGKIYPSIEPKTVADGLRTSLGEKTFDIIRRFTNRIITVNDTRIIEAMRLIFERMKIIIEPSSAVPLAAVLANKIIFEGKKTGIILSGGNADFDNLPWK